MSYFIKSSFTFKKRLFKIRNMFCWAGFTEMCISTAVLKLWDMEPLWDMSVDDKGNNEKN